jgi:ribosomal protein L3 glutamine methyltransferase
VDAEDMAALGAEFGFEPELGLRAGEDGLAVVDRILAAAGEYLDDDGVLFIEVGNSQAALQQKYDFLPLTWVELEYGGGGVCCIEARDLNRQRDAITALAS